MTTDPKVKANELVELFWDATYKDNRVADFEITLLKHLERTKKSQKGYDSIERAKSCALITVEEILKTSASEYAPEEDFWKSVQEEINKL